jgi:hypothetical protein
MKSINIKGKNYVMVNDRIKFFRESEKYKGWSLTSEFVSVTEDTCIIKAIVTNEDGFVAPLRSGDTHRSPGLRIGNPQRCATSTHEIRCLISCKSYIG